MNESPKPTSRRFKKAALVTGLAAISFIPGSTPDHEPVALLPETTATAQPHEAIPYQPEDMIPVIPGLDSADEPMTVTYNDELPTIPTDVVTETGTSLPENTTTTTTTTTLPRIDGPSTTNPENDGTDDTSRVPIIPDTTTPDTGGPDTTTPNTGEIGLPQLPVYEVTPEISKIMEHDTVVLPGLGCSGFLVRNEEGVPIGFSTAEHCGLRDNYRQRFTGSDGKEYVLSYSDIYAYQGQDINNLQTVGDKVTQFVVNPSGDLNRDSAYGIFEGHTYEEVRANDKRLTPAETEALQLGDVIYMSGWPIDQDNNPGAQRRQEFAMTILGTKTAYITSGEVLEVLWAGVKSNEDGAECTFRASGSQGFIEQDGKSVHVGDLAAFDDLVGDTWRTPEDAAFAKKYYGAIFGVDLGEFAAVCGFAYEEPSTKINVVTSVFDIPGYGEDGTTTTTSVPQETTTTLPGDTTTTVPEEETTTTTTPEEVIDWEDFYQESREKFFDPEYERSVIDGIVYLDMRGGKSPVEEIWIDRPVIFYDPGSKKTLISMYDESGENNLLFYPFEDLKQVNLYDRDEEPNGIEILTSKGGLETPTQDDPNRTGGFQDPQGLAFSRIVPEFDPEGKQLYKVFDNNGELMTTAVIPN